MRLALLTSFAAALLSGCVHYRVVPADEARPYAEPSWLYAQLAYNSYHRKKAPQFEIPKEVVLTVSAGNDDIGLAYDIYERPLGAAQHETIFVFRGTEGSPGVHNCDWKYGNFSLRQQERATGAVLLYLGNSRPAPAKVTFAGHSLGGGIAVHASYRVDRSQAFIFNSSPVFRRPRPWPSRAANGEAFVEPDRLSIAERGEFLKIGRLFGSEANQTFQPVDCTRDGGSVSQHSMRDLAICLTRRARASKTDLVAAKAAEQAIRMNETLFDPSLGLEPGPPSPPDCKG